jgi:hypothetical protein
VIPTTGFTAPEQYFQALQAYVSRNYYSNNTTFAVGMPGPADVFVPDDRYFYGACIPGVSSVAGTCQSINGQPVRKIARKGPLYWAFLSMGINDPTKAGIDSVIAQEQFAELGPVIAQHVAAFIQFYAPALTVTVQGSGTVTSSPGNGLNCSSGTCSALFVQGAPVTLTATSGVTWGGDCSSAGTSSTVKVTLTADQNCTATFQQTGGTLGVSISSVDCNGNLPHPQWWFNWQLTVTGTASGPVGASLVSGAYDLSYSYWNDTVRYHVIGGLGMSCSAWTGCVRQLNQPPSTQWTASVGAISPIFTNSYSLITAVQASAQGSTVSANGSASCP